MKNEDKDIDMFDVQTELHPFARILASRQMEIRVGVRFEMVVAWMINVTVRLLTLAAPYLMYPKADAIFSISSLSAPGFAQQHALGQPRSVFCLFVRNV